MCRPVIKNGTRATIDALIRATNRDGYSVGPFTAGNYANGEGFR